MESSPMTRFPPSSSTARFRSKALSFLTPISFPNLYYCLYCTLGWAYQLHGAPAHYPLDGMPERDDISSDSHKHSLTISRGGERNLTKLSQPLLHDVWPDYKAISYFIRAIRGEDLEDRKRGIHAATIKTGLDLETPLATALLGFYSSRNDLESAWQIFDLVAAKDLILWSAMVSACCKNGWFDEAVATLGEMQSFGVTPNEVCLVSALPACANTGALQCGRQIHAFGMRREFHAETNLQNALIDMYAKCGKVDASMAVFNGIKEKDVISWRSVILGCIDNRWLRKALELFSSMRASRSEHDEMTVRNVIGVCSQVGNLMFGSGLHCYAIKNGFTCFATIGTPLLKMYAEFKDVKTTMTLFDHLTRKDLIAWSTMVSVYSKIGQPVLALDKFSQMQSENLEANEITLVSLLGACSLVEAHEHGRSIHAYVIRQGYDFNMFVTSALIDFYCKVGRLEQGEVLFYNLKNKDVICWTSMINGYGVNGFGEEAMKTFSNMLDNGMVPNEVVFVSILSACSHCGMLDEGWKLFYSMEEKYGISPILAHYSCIVDMLGRSGNLKEALVFIYKMPIAPDASLWSALLSWCRSTDDDITVAEIAAEQLIILDPGNPSYLVTLSNMYCKLGWWDDVERIRQLIEERGLRKQVGCSMGFIGL